MQLYSRHLTVFDLYLQKTASDLNGILADGQHDGLSSETMNLLSLTRYIINA